MIESMDCWGLDFLKAAKAVIDINGLVIFEKES